MRQLADIFKERIKLNELTSSCNNAIMILSYNKRCIKDLKNHRSINILSNLYKLFTKALTKTINAVLNFNQPKETSKVQKCVFNK